MTAEQLEELLGKVTQGEWYSFTEGEWIIDPNKLLCKHADATLIALAPSLARRVIAAEKLMEAGRAMANDAEHGFVTGRSIASWGAAETAYREASK